MAPFLYTQVHCVRDNQLLLMHRNKAPNLGLWVAPGGTIEAGESPYECAARELLEEAGLRAHTLYFRGLVSVAMPAISAPFMQFLYLVTELSGEMVADEREGSLQWWPIVEALRVVPRTLAVYLPDVLDPTRPFYQARFVYDANWQLTEVIEHATAVAPLSE